MSEQYIEIPENNLEAEMKRNETPLAEKVERRRKTNRDESPLASIEAVLDEEHILGLKRKQEISKLREELFDRMVERGEVPISTGSRKLPWKPEDTPPPMPDRLAHPRTRGMKDSRNAQLPRGDRD